MFKGVPWWVEAKRTITDKAREYGNKQQWPIAQTDKFVEWVKEYGQPTDDITRLATIWAEQQ